MYTPRDTERAMYIYKQRKEAKRRFVDIGRDLGITGKRVAYIYRRIDWNLNGYNADHHQKPHSAKSGVVLKFQQGETK